MKNNRAFQSKESPWAVAGRAAIGVDANTVLYLKQVYSLRFVNEILDRHTLLELVQAPL